MMWYTEKQKQEIESVLEVFAEYIKNSKYVDMVRSEKLGYVLLRGLSANMDDFCMQPLVIKSGKMICEQMYCEIVRDVMEENDKLEDDDISSEEKEELYKRLKPYDDKLPQFHRMVEKLLG